ncbi:serine/threonine-protein kinase [Streptomyces sp. NPDC088387]|uniref:serine/threonine-protein kinase n=1 Tax=Streptomyces sp. NPDC088387 TaxID=3365859 RepID=UPI00380B4F78
MNTPGDVVDERFELLERLGSGGMGTVWRARDLVLHREVALKAVRPDIEATPAIRERVMREARALARLSNPHVVSIHQIIAADPHPWIVMELVPGTTLQRRLTDGPLGPTEAARLGRQVLAGLRAAHAAGIRHRDVKPANILLRPDGSAVLTDFGIAALQGASALTMTGELVGSPEYMAPECLRGNDGEPASDLWSLGLVLYVCVEGVSPLRRQTTFATLAAVLEDAVPPPVRSGPLAPVLQSLLVHDPAARPDAARLDDMLAQVESGATPYWAAAPTLITPSPTPPVPEPATTPTATPTQLDTPRPSRPARRRAPALIAGAAVLAVGAVGALVIGLLPPDDSANNANETTAGTGNSSVPTPSKDPGDSTSPPSSSPSAGESPSASAPPGGGGWVAQLFSEPTSTGVASRDKRLALIRETVPEAVYVRSDDYASLRPGFWVIYAPGPFADGRAALDHCAKLGRTSLNDCMGRYLSTNASDYDLQCRPPAASPTGRCTRE